MCLPEEARTVTGFDAEQSILLLATTMMQMDCKKGMNDQRNSVWCCMNRQGRRWTFAHGPNKAWNFDKARDASKFVEK